MLKKQSKIKVKADKSHLLTLGEKMYRESIEFVRELVDNAYDADASEAFTWQSKLLKDAWRGKRVDIVI